MLFADVEIPHDTGEFPIMNRRSDRRVVPAQGKVTGSLRGLVAFVGFNQGFVDFDRTERAAGDSNLPPV